MSRSQLTPEELASNRAWAQSNGFQPLDQKQAQQQFPTLGDQQPGGTSPMSPPQAQTQGTQAPKPPAQQPAPQTTFRQMQQQGVARPAPSMAAPWGFTPPQGYGQPPQQPAPQFGYGASPIGNQVQGLLSKMIATPTAYDDNVIKAQRDAAVSGLNQQAKQSQDLVNEEMARRGVWASSVAGGRLGDIEVNRLNALKDLEASFLGNRAAAMDAGQRAAAGLGMQYDQSQFQNQLGAFNANLNARGMDQDNAYRWGSLGENARQFNQGFGLDTQKFGEDTRRFNQGFGEDMRRYDQGFGEDRRRFDQNFDWNQQRDARDFGEDTRRYDQGFGEDQRRWDKNYGFQDRDWNWQAMRDLLGDYGDAGLTEIDGDMAWNDYGPADPGLGGPEAMPFNPDSMPELYGGY